MPHASRNTQLFALKDAPPPTVQVAGTTYALVRVFKHDFWAATMLYEAVESGTGVPPVSSRGTGVSPVSSSLTPVPTQREETHGRDGHATTAHGQDAHATPIPKIVVKHGREAQFAGLELAWYGQWLRAHEEAIYRLLKGVPGIPRWVGHVGQTGFAIEYIEAVPLDHIKSPPPGFFERLRKVFDAVHARGIGYCDANKRSNILVDAAGQPYLIDYQISVRLRDDLPWPLSAVPRFIVNWAIQKDLYHLYKHKRRMSPAELTPEEDAMSRKRGLLHRGHRNFLKFYHAIRRPFLRKQHREGHLVSVTNELENHYQPEKRHWRE
jgi:hypothetical protein